jgi:hypothetical protein
MHLKHLKHFWILSYNALFIESFNDNFASLEPKGLIPLSNNIPSNEFFKQFTIHARDYNERKFKSQ